MTLEQFLELRDGDLVVMDGEPPLRWRWQHASRQEKLAAWTKIKAHWDVTLFRVVRMPFGARR